MSRVAVGIVGAGVMGQRHLRALLDCPSARVVGVADHSADHSHQVDVPTCRDLVELLELGAEAVIVATPAGTHRILVEQCLAAGVHVLVEKPLATTVPDVRAVVDSARRARSVAVVGHVDRFAPVMSDIAAMVQAEAPATIETTRIGGPRPTRIRDVGVLLDLAVHDIDLVRWATGREYVDMQVDVHATSVSGHETSATLYGVLDDGTTVTHEVSWLAPRPVRRWLLQTRVGRRASFDLLSAGTSLAEQDEAFVAACGRGPVGSLATFEDGAAAVELALGSRAEAVRGRAEPSRPTGAAASVGRSAAGGSCAPRT